MSNSLRFHGLQLWLPCPLLSPGVCSDSCPLSQWCHPTIWFSVNPFSSCPQPLLASGPFLWLFTLGGQNIEASASVLYNENFELIFFSIDRFDLLAVQGTRKTLLQHHNSKAPVLRRSTFSVVQLSHLYMTTGKTITLTIWKSCVSVF